MSATRLRLPAAITLAGFLLLGMVAGCTERNMGSANKDGGWTKVEMGSKSAAPAEPLRHADAVNVTYYYLPG